jgi:hypothetical protein
MMEAARNVDALCAELSWPVENRVPGVIRDAFFGILGLMAGANDELVKSLNQVFFVVIFLGAEVWKCGSSEMRNFGSAEVRKCGSDFL